MKLEEQFKEATTYQYQEYAGAHPSTWEMDSEDLNKCAQITRTFTIVFYDWAQINTYKYPTNTTTEQLLEIYEKTL